MLHCASTAKVVRPLAFVAGVLPDAAVGAGVAQIQGWVCEPSNTGPPIGWLVIVSRARCPPSPSNDDFMQFMISSSPSATTPASASPAPARKAVYHGLRRLRQLRETRGRPVL